MIEGSGPKWLFDIDSLTQSMNYVPVTAGTSINESTVKDGDAKGVDVHLYRSMIGSLMYLTASRPDIMFVVCACARFQVTPKTSHLLAVKRIFRYLKGKPTLGLWYSRNSPFELVTYTDSDYAGATQDRKSITGGCQFLGSQQLKLNMWLLLAVVDNTICIIENPVQHSKTKHIKIRHHFIRDYNAKKLIQMVKIDTEHNVVDLLTKGLDAGRTDGKVEITATIDGHVKTITEASLRRHLKLEDNEGETSLPNSEIFEQLALIGYVTDSYKLTFQKENFSPQWRFLIYTILHCLSPKKTSWEQFSSNKYASYFDSSSKDVGNDELKSVDDDPKYVKDGPINGDDDKDKSEDASSTKQDNTADQPVNTASPRLNTGGIGLNTVGSLINTATPEDMVGPSYTLETTHDEFLHNEDDTKVDLGNILNSYIVPTTPHTRIHINHPLTNVISDIQSSVQTRRMKEPASE
ncbi:hypothetical protein Tco_0773053 [Tanacetum coccineum]|uniref:Uncharacterized protein n=1 Tax=Tanacetum coccineum TaxID=301880 RepID=A0ABQ4ZNE0_9ASTR